MPVKPEETLRSLLLMQLKTPGVELVILTDISDEAVLNYVARHLKKALILSKNARWRRWSVRC